MPKSKARLGCAIVLVLYVIVDLLITAGVTVPAIALSETARQAAQQPQTVLIIAGYIAMILFTLFVASFITFIFFLVIGSFILIGVGFFTRRPISFKL